MSTTEETAPVLRTIEKFIADAKGCFQLLDGVCELLHTHMPRYNWVGFYMIEERAGEETMLVLGPYRGSMTPHTRIKMNQGICGAAASGGKTIVVDDVHSDQRYLACSLETKSEIVVPLFVDGKVVGELDIDSHFPAAFAPPDRLLCERTSELVGQFLSKLAKQSASRST
jgi:GAF domain-containing protein